MSHIDHEPIALYTRRNLSFQMEDDMYKDVKAAKRRLKAWIKSRGWKGNIRFLQSYGLITVKGRPAWSFDLIEPYGVLNVFNDNGDVEDNYGTLDS